MTLPEGNIYQVPCHVKKRLAREYGMMVFHRQDEQGRCFVKPALKSYEEALLPQIKPRIINGEQEA